MKMTVLVDNIGTEKLPGEWGLSLYIEHNGLRWLLDAGQSDLYLRNARALGIDLALVDHAVLSHAHYDHADGLMSFLALNGRADLLVAAGAGERCWKIKDGQWKYIGIAKGLLAKAGGRLRRCSAMTQVEGVSTSCPTQRLASNRPAWPSRCTSGTAMTRAPTTSPTSRASSSRRRGGLLPSTVARTPART